MIRRAHEVDLEVLLPLIEAFYEIDRHPYDEEGLIRALVPLLGDGSELTDSAIDLTARGGRDRADESRLLRG